MDTNKELERIKDRMRELLWEYEQGKVSNNKLNSLMYAYYKYSQVLDMLNKECKKGS